MYKIIIDSCGELTDDMKKDGRFISVPLILEVDGVEIIDDESFDQADFLKRVEESEKGPKSACPSPSAYMEAYEGPEERVYAVTLSAQLSGSYNSAVLAKGLYEEEHEDEDKKIHVFDSKSASIGETLIGLKIAEAEEAGHSFEEVIEIVDAYIEEQHTFFVLESLETLRKNGRLSNLKAAIANSLNLKPIMGSADDGNIQQLGQVRGIKKAVDKMADYMIEVTKETEKKILAISHCNAPERAEALKKKILSLASFAEIIILDTRGVSSMYASDGGVIMVV